MISVYSGYLAPCALGCDLLGQGFKRFNYTRYKSRYGHKQIILLCSFPFSIWFLSALANSVWMWLLITQPSTAPFPLACVCPCFSGSLTELKMDLFSQMFGLKTRLMGGPGALCRAWSQNTNDTINQQNRSLSHAKIISYVLFTNPPLKVSSQCRYLSLSSD